MNTLPQLLEEDIRQFNDALTELLDRTEATTALVMDQGGFLLTHQGDHGQFDLTTIAALTSGAYLANQTIASLVHETNFTSVYQQGEKFSLYAVCIDGNCLLLVAFQSPVGVGTVKHHATAAVEKVAAQLKQAYQRNPAAGYDLSVFNLADPGPIFQRTGMAPPAC